MYLIERQIHNIPQSPDSKAAFEKIKKKLAREEEKAKKGQANEFEPVIRRDESVCDTPDAGPNCYAFNETFVDVRTPFDEMRGGITLAAVCFLAAPVGVMAPFAFQEVFPSWLSGIHYSTGLPIEFADYLFDIAFLSLPSLAIGLALYFGWRHLRLEAFVQRRLLVRFNRQTRKVYVHRPAYAGGVIELPWDEVRPDGVHPGGDEGAGVGGVLMLMWLPQHSPRQEIELVIAGRRARSNSETTNFWEFIRRYMEEGPQAVPRPRLIGKFPWPWVPLQASLSLVWPLWQMRSLNWMAPLLLLISPAILLFAAGQWLSLLTCWEPVFPRAIRQASGEGFMSVVRARLFDLGAWAMLAGLVVGVVHLISNA